MPSSLLQNTSAESEATPKSLGVLEKILENFTVQSQEFMIFLFLKLGVTLVLKICRQNRLSNMFFKNNHRVQGMNLISTLTIAPSP